MRRRFALFHLIAAIVVAIPLAAFVRQEPVLAAANLYTTNSSSVDAGDNITINIMVNTGGASANAFDATFSYPDALFDGVRGSYSGSICTLPIIQPDPSGGTATFSCGRPSGYTGTGLVASIVLRAKSTGTAVFSLSGCSVLANDGQGTNITGSCGGSSTTINAAAIPTPTPTPGNTPTPTPGSTPTPTATGRTRVTPTPKPSPTPSAPAKVVEQVNPNTPTPEAVVGGPVATLEPPTPTPERTELTEGEEETAPTEARSIGESLSALFGSLRDISKVGANTGGLIALLITVIPFLALIFGIMLFGYRLYNLERRRRRTLDRLFEMELAELAALEGKMDLLAEKGSKGREQYREEFQKAKENILRQVKPEYGKPIDPVKKEAPKTAEAPSAQPEKK